MKFLVYIVAALAVASATDEKKQEKRGLLGLGYGYGGLGYGGLGHSVPIASTVVTKSVVAAPVVTKSVVSSPIVVKSYSAPIISSPIVAKSYVAPVVLGLGHGFEYGGFGHGLYGGYGYGYLH